MKNADSSIEDEQYGSLTAHVQDVGDVSAPLSSWVNDEYREKTIEGFKLSLGSDQLDDQITYRAISRDGSLDARVAGGGFCGTTNKSQPIFGFVIEHWTSGNTVVAITCEGAFLDGTSCGPVKPGDPCVSQSGAPLVAMRINVSKVQLSPAPQPMTALKQEKPAISPNAALMRMFVSMGGNCEFGIAQSRCGAEPLDLLRWGNTNMGVLLGLLRDRFRRLGDASLTKISVLAGEYIVENIHYGFRWHTWVKVDDMSHDRILRRELGRMPKQAELLMETMAEGQRILVRIADDNASVVGLDELVKLIANYGDSKILFVSVDEKKSGTIERIGPTLLRGYMVKFADPAEVGPTTDTDAWLQLCRKAVSL